MCKSNAATVAAESTTTHSVARRAISMRQAMRAVIGELPYWPSRTTTVATFTFPNRKLRGTSGNCTSLEAIRGGNAESAQTTAAASIATAFVRFVAWSPFGCGMILTILLRRLAYWVELVLSLSPARLLLKVVEAEVCSDPGSFVFHGFTDRLCPIEW
jgi:hypothetical protein